MRDFNPSRRSLLLGGAATVAGASAMSADQLFGFAKAWAQASQWNQRRIEAEALLHFPVDG